jgi:hypothetical protein
MKEMNLIMNNIANQVGTAPLQNFSREHIMASKLPQNIKEAMINRPIDKPSMGTSFSAEDIEEINPKRQQPQQRHHNN